MDGYTNTLATPYGDAHFWTFNSASISIYGSSGYSIYSITVNLWGFPTQMDAHTGINPIGYYSFTAPIKLEDLFGPNQSTIQQLLQASSPDWSGATYTT